MSSCRKHIFSLVEVTVVVAIMAVLCSIAAVRIREESPGSRFEKALQEFREFLLLCRNSAREKGEDTGVYFQPGENRCIAAPVADPSFDRDDDTYWVNASAPPKFLLEEFSGDALRKKYGMDNETGEVDVIRSWSIPEDFSLTANTDENDGSEEQDPGAEGILLFTCFAGGSVAGNGVTLSCGGLSAVITCTPLSGAFVITDGEE